MKNEFTFKPNENDEMILKNGSIIDVRTFITKISNRERYCVYVTCGKCKKRRIVPIWNIKKNFTGFCKNCFPKSSWKIKRGYSAKKRIASNGYVVLYLPNNPMANSRGEVYEHRLVMSQILGRPLTRFEHVHHKDGIKLNNLPKNLELIPNSAHHNLITKLQSHIKHLESILTKHNIKF